MTTIQANIYKNGDTSKPVTGFIRVKARATIIDGVNLFIPDAEDYPLVLGLATFSLVASDVDKVSYSFEIYEVDGDPVLLYSFDATVPSSLATIPFNSLAAQSGLRHDQQDASLLVLADYVLNNPLFSNRITDKILNVRGTYNSSSLYRKGDSVLYDGDGYIYTNDISYANKIPTDNAFWKQYVSKGSSGSGTAGDNSPYSSAWSGSTVAPSRNAIYSKIETLVSLASANNSYGARVDGVFTRPLLDGASPLAPGDNSARLVHSNWVQNEVSSLRNQIPVGARVKWDTNQALPVKYIRADGGAYSRTAYPVLYTTYGNTYGSGNGSTTFNVPNEPGFIIFTGV